MATKIRTPSVSVLPLCLFHIRKCFKSVDIIFLEYFFFCNVCCSFFKQRNIRTVFFPSVIFQWDRKKWNIKRCISKSISIVIPVILSFLFSCLISFHLFFYILYHFILYIFFSYFFFIILFAVDELFVCLLVSDPKVLSNICLLMVRKNDNDHLAGSIETSDTYTQQKMISLNCVDWKLIRRWCTLHSTPKKICSS